MRSVALLAAGALAALLAVGCGAQAPRDGAPHFDERFVRQRPEPRTQDEEHWPAVLRTDCGAPAPGGMPSVCIRRAGGESVRRGEALSAELSWHGVPANASIIVSLERDAPATERYLGATGALVLTPIPVSGNGTMRFDWNGHEFPCAPTDFPMLCQQQAEIGRYRLRVALYDRRQIVIVGWPSREQPVVLAYSLSSPFVVTGQPDLSQLARSMWWAAVNARMQAREIDSSSAIAGDTNGSAVRIMERGGQLCARIPASPPYVSTLEACIPKARLIGDAGLLMVTPEEIPVTGRITVSEGAISRREAITLAQAAADRPYRPRVAFQQQPGMEEAGYNATRDGDYMAWSRRNPWASTYLSNSAQETVYRPDLGGAWLIVVNEIMAGGSLPDDQRFADKVLVLVRADRRACVLETRPYRGAQFSMDPRTVRPAC